jgi:hypothetical protein
MKKIFLIGLFIFLFDSNIALSQSQNYLINGSFAFWQRGNANAQVDGNGYLADRWYATAGTYDRNASNLPTGHYYGAQLAFSASSGWLCQRIESTTTYQLSGKTMAISGYERSSVGSGPLKFKIDRPNTIDSYSGRGKNGSTLTNELAATTLLGSTSTTLTKFRYNFTVSANMAAYGFQVCFGTDSSTTTTYQLSAIMLNEGVRVQPFSMAGKLIGNELALVQRYFEKSYNLSTNLGTQTSDGIAQITSGTTTTNEVDVIVYHKSMKFTQPTVTVWDYTGNINKVTYWASHNSTGAVNGSNSSSFRITSDNVTSKTNGDMRFHWASDAEL